MALRDPLAMRSHLEAVRPPVLHALACDLLFPGCMPEIFLDRRQQHFDSAPETWGDLLAALDAQAAAEGVILTVARFDGVDEPSFREPEAIVRVLEGIGRVDVETAKPTAFLRECLLDATRWLERSAELAQRLAIRYRDVDGGGGQEGLAAIVNDLRSLVTLVAMLQGSLGIDLRTIQVDGVSAAHAFEALEATLTNLVAAHDERDLHRAADLLEDDLEPTFRRWVALLNVLAARLDQ
jgi:hypothetical protein